MLFRSDPIWIMWYQGIENAPDIVKCCIESVKENCSGHEVIVLSEQNLSEFPIDIYVRNIFVAVLEAKRRYFKGCDFIEIIS